MVKARGGKVWHKQAKAAGEVPKGLTGLDKEATWSYSKADGWIYGHGTFCLTSHGKSVVGLFIWIAEFSLGSQAIRRRSAGICQSSGDGLYRLES